jgi:hypothetical protein
VTFAHAAAETEEKAPEEREPHVAYGGYKLGILEDLVRYLFESCPKVVAVIFIVAYVLFSGS